MHTDPGKGAGCYFKLMRRHKRDIYIDVRPAVIPPTKSNTMAKLQYRDLVKALKRRTKSGFDLLKVSKDIMQTTAGRVNNHRCRPLNNET